MNETPAIAGRTEAGWFKSSHSAADNECVEVAFHGPTTAIRDSKAPARGVLAVPHATFAAFVEALKG
ncbi:DUF397 domain-containing protein [Streptomyces shenzhenensis]|uniref:DUF397 domain-containing protein n=1 Tax=Streptomyces shenzhenensis TaxID=943815 RepID=UPI0015F10C93|nr:DUF397 domain-containing protein [Streptomyces shenzhenensis]